MTSSSPSARSLALETLDRVFFGGAYSHIALASALDEADLSRADRGLATELVYGTLTRKRTLDTLLGTFVDRPIDGLDRPVLLSLRMAAYQLVFLDRIPQHAAVHEAVELVKAQCSRGAAGFTNGVLRSMLRKRKRWNIWETIDPEKEQVRYLGVRHSLPNWIVALLIDAHGFTGAERQAKAFNTRPPLYFRTLEKSDGAPPDGVSPVAGVPGCFRAESMSGELMESIRQHRMVIQDLGSQLIGHFATADGARRILDACAGLGGKALHLAQLADAEASVVAIEPHQSKLTELRKTVADTSFEDRIELFHGELADFSDDSDDFDLVLVDAPCSGLGVIRRHPETRWRRTQKDVDNRAALQKKLLAQAATHVSPGGLLVYGVCTFTEEEGPDQTEEFLRDHSDFEREAPPKESEIDWSRFINESGDLELNPADHDTDAFYAARLRRRA